MCKEILWVCNKQLLECFSSPGPPLRQSNRENFKWIHSPHNSLPGGVFEARVATTTTTTVRCRPCADRPRMSRRFVSVLKTPLPYKIDLGYTDVIQLVNLEAFWAAWLHHLFIWVTSRDLKGAWTCCLTDEKQVISDRRSSAVCNIGMLVGWSEICPWRPKNMVYYTWHLCSWGE